TLVDAGNGRIFVGSDKGLWSCDTNGLFWVQASPSLPRVTIRAVCVASDYTLYAAGQNNSNYFVYRSDDTGKTWVDITHNAAQPVMALLATPTHVFAGIPNGMYLSANKGASWTFFKGDVGTFAKSSSGVLIAGGLEGIFTSTDGGNSWHQNKTVLRGVA